MTDATVIPTYCTDLPRQSDWECDGTVDPRVKAIEDRIRKQGADGRVIFEATLVGDTLSLKEAKGRDKPSSGQDPPPNQADAFPSTSIRAIVNVCNPELGWAYVWTPGTDRLAKMLLDGSLKARMEFALKVPCEINLPISAAGPNRHRIFLSPRRSGDRPLEPAPP